MRAHAVPPPAYGPDAHASDRTLSKDKFWREFCDEYVCYFVFSPFDFL